MHYGGIELRSFDVYLYCLNVIPSKDIEVPIHAYNYFSVRLLYSCRSIIGRKVSMYPRLRKLKSEYQLYMLRRYAVSEVFCLF